MMNWQPIRFIMKNYSTKKLWTFLAVSGLALVFSVPANAGLLTVGPDYKRPTNSVPANYKAVDLGEWKEGKPLDTMPKGNWWEIFGDAGLNGLESRALNANQELKAAVARVEQA